MPHKVTDFSGSYRLQRPSAPSSSRYQEESFTEPQALYFLRTMLDEPGNADVIDDLLEEHGWSDHSVPSRERIERLAREISAGTIRVFRQKPDFKAVATPLLAPAKEATPDPSAVSPASPVSSEEGSQTQTAQDPPPPTTGGTRPS